MGFILFNEKSRIVKNELDAYLWKVGQGFKMSRKARTMLGIKDDTIHNLAVGTTEGEVIKLIIKAVNTKEEGNCTVNKQNVISSNKVVTALESFGDKFKITSDKMEDFFIMVIENKVVENTSVETEIEEEVTETVEEQF